MEQLVIHYSYEGNLIPIDSDEAKTYLQSEKYRLYKFYWWNKSDQKLCTDKARIHPTALFENHETKELSPLEIKQSNEQFQCKKW